MSGGWVRRQVLAGAAIVAGAAATGIGAVPAAAGATADRVRTTRRVMARRGGHYPANADPLAPTAFLRLPPGSVTARGWLDTQLRMQLAGLNGQYEKISHFLDYDTTGWVHPDAGGWEELPYWLRGYASLGHVTGDETVLANTGRWIDGILATQQPDGFFGPTALRTSLNGGPDFWPYLPLMDALRSYQEYTGDERIVPFLTAFARYMSQQDGAVFATSWISYRLATALDTIFWLYNRTGEPWLLELADTMHTNGQDWVDNLPTPHNVNIAQGFREPAMYALRSGEEGLTQAAYHDYEQVMDGSGGFPGGGFAGDENIRTGYHDPRQGFESCGIVEFMGSHETLLAVTGDPVWADRCEELAFNMLPAALDPWGTGIHYITSANGIDLDDEVKTDGQFDNLFAMQAYMPGVDQYRCCPHNYGQGWPYFAENLWLASPDGGLCAAMYAPSAVTATVGDGARVTVTEDTGYPFDGTVTLHVDPERPVGFPLYVRIPGWCGAARIAVNGGPATTGGGPAFAVLSRTWSPGDAVTIRLQQNVVRSSWPNGAVSVGRGPLLYSLKIGEQYTRFGGDDQFPEYSVAATTPWNYGLPAPDGAAATVVTRHPPAGSNPFTHDGSPLELRVPARRLPEWRSDAQHVVRTLQPGPTSSGQPTEQVTLLPMGAARLRVTAFPVLTDGPDAHGWIVPATESASWCYAGDSVEALDDGLDPAGSYDQTMPRQTFWPHLGGTEWVQYDFDAPTTVGRVAVYWYDDTGYGSCRVPRSWSLLYRDAAGSWQPAAGASGYGTDRDTYNVTTLTPVTTTGLRLAVTLQDGVSAGILEWRATPLSAGTAPG
jgi:beta-L-arabinofuranosidase (glycosyl hydrolase family 127)/glycosyl hydrolase family 127 (putative beta-L-arabinofuranosidase)